MPMSSNAGGEAATPAPALASPSTCAELHIVDSVSACPPSQPAPIHTQDTSAGDGAFTSARADTPYGSAEVDEDADAGSAGSGGAAASRASTGAGGGSTAPALDSSLLDAILFQPILRAMLGLPEVPIVAGAGAGAMGDYAPDNLGQWGVISRGCEMLLATALLADRLGRDSLLAHDYQF